MTTTVAHLVVLLLTVASSSAAPAPDPLWGWTGQAPTEGVWPLQPPPAVVVGFDPPLSPYGAGHRGVDLAGRAGQVVHAAAGGRVSFAGTLAGRGVVVVTHGRARTTYEPVRAAVVVGATVAAGDRLGTLETSGSHCSPDPCLHWGLLEGETYLDPLTLVGGGPVRLLPLGGLAVPGGRIALGGLGWLAGGKAPRTALRGSGADRWGPASSPAGAATLTRPALSGSALSSSALSARRPPGPARAV